MHRRSFIRGTASLGLCTHPVLPWIRWLVCLSGCLIFWTVSGRSQSFHDFEQGPKGWEFHGATPPVFLDSHRSFPGKRVLALLGGQTIDQRTGPLAPLSIVDYQFRVQVNVVKTGAFCYIRFFDSLDRELGTFKSAIKHSDSAMEAGDYLEAPLYTKYARIGLRNPDAEDTLYALNLEWDLKVGEPTHKATPLCNLDQYMKPFWKSDTIFNETVLLYSRNGSQASGNLLSEPAEIISVRSYDLKNEYARGRDYTLQGRTITRTSGSMLPFRADTSFDTQHDLAWYNLQSQWVVVTYRHRDTWNGPAIPYQGRFLPHTLAKLKSKKQCIIAAYGMSITRGMDVSGYDTIPPYMPTYVDLFTRGLRKAFLQTPIQLYNAALPGSTIQWGADNVLKYLSPLKADLVILDFGMNDFWSTAPEQFRDHLKSIISKCREANPSAEFLILSNLEFDPDYILDSDRYKGYYLNNFMGYQKMIKSLETTGIAQIDMTRVSDFIYRRKKAKDCLVNPLHPNDYMARWYAQCMVQALVPYK